MQVVAIVGQSDRAKSSMTTLKFPINLKNSSKQIISPLHTSRKYIYERNGAHL